MLALSACASVPPASETDRAAAAAISGEWGVQIKEIGHTAEGTLHFSFDGVAVVGTYLGPDGEIQELENVRIGGGKVFWQMEQKSGTTTARGGVNGTIMSGKMKLRLRQEADGSTGAAGRAQGYGGRAAELSFAWTAIKRAPGEEAPSKP